ncbi:MAG TPA: isoprenylcysteine carboxylmethyltransferase family protein [Terriglobales bacterium]|nr:isoprenylcysteine carboxylmethyltransferase family protein [Terriglobales bacterium]
MRRVLQAIASMALWIAATFAGAGRLNWTRGWICVALYAVTMSALAIIVGRKNPGLLQERMNWRRKDTKPFDKIFLLLLFFLAFAFPAVAGLDAVRFRWSSMSFVAVYPGAILFWLAAAAMTWALVVNPYAESTVRIQTERGHRVISSGPYHFVRHPMYVGMILMYPAMALILGSLAALALSGMIALLFVWRTVMEDRTLRRELAGYDEYARATRFRLIPGIW